MKTELEKKLDKLPAFIETDFDGYCVWELRIIKTAKNNHWFIEYTDSNDNSIIIVEHQSLQAAVDTTLKEIKNL